MAASRKRSSYPSSQMRGGPAPLASFEDLSDEIESPEDPDAVTSPTDATLVLDDDDEDDRKTFSEGATPSTPRVLAQTPSTPLTLDGFSIAGTPDSLGREEGSFPGESAEPETPVPLIDSGTITPSRGSVFSPRSSPLFGRRSKATTPELRPLSSSINNSKKSTEVPDVVKPKHTIKAGTPSPRSSRKLFTMAFFKPKEDKTPSPTTGSPKSPRRHSPAASPKSPRRAPPFGGLFRTRDREDVDPASSPSKKKSHFPHFPWTTSSSSSSSQDSGVDQSRKDGRHHGGSGVFASLFRRSEHKEQSTSSKPECSSQTPDNEEWILQTPSIDATTTVAQQAPIIAEPTTDVLPVVDTDGNRSPGTESTDVFVSAHDIAGDSMTRYAPELRLGLSPSADVLTVTHLGAELNKEKSDEDIEQQCENEYSNEENKKPTAVTVLEDLGPLEIMPDDKPSPESEADLSETQDPAALKTLRGDEPEAETLLREDSFENEDFLNGSQRSLEESLLEDIKLSSEKDASRHRDKLAAFSVNPVDRPRSTAPISFAPLEAYISIVAPSTGSFLPADYSPEKTKLKVVLPGEEFGPKSRLSRKPDAKSWFEFCEMGLLSPRSRRRQQHSGCRPVRAPSSVPASRKTTFEEDDEDGRRTGSLDFEFVTSSNSTWTTFDSETTSSVLTAPENGQVEKTPAPDVILPLVREDAKRTWRHPSSSSASSRSSSPKEEACCSDVDPASLRDEEVEPLVTDVDGASDDSDGFQSPNDDDVLYPHDVVELSPQPKWSNGIVDLLSSLPSKTEPSPGHHLASAAADHLKGLVDCEPFADANQENGDIPSSSVVGMRVEKGT